VGLRQEEKYDERRGNSRALLVIFQMLSEFKERYVLFNKSNVGAV